MVDAEAIQDSRRMRAIDNHGRSMLMERENGCRY